MPEKTILVIEDSPELADSLRDILSLHGFLPIITTTGGDGIAAALQHHPDLTLLDIRLPDMSGYDVLQKIRQDTWGESARVLILTASEALDTIAKNVSLPREDILFKPNISIPVLVEKIKMRLTY